MNEIVPITVIGSRRGKPGRPRKGDAGIFSSPVSGHSAGTVTTKPQARSGDPHGPEVSQTAAPVVPRLLDLNATAAYLGVSTWTVRDLEQSGILPRIRIPLPGKGEVRKLLFDKKDLDRLIEAWKERSG